MRFLALIAIAGALCSGDVAAGSAAGHFNVNITVRDGSSVPHGDGICVSEALSASTNAVVRVACQNGQFVDISPVPGRPFAATHGGAFRFSFGPGYRIEPALEGTADALLGTGTVTAMRIYRADDENGALEMLVSF
jgi:hypothetical protein